MRKDYVGKRSNGRYNNYGISQDEEGQLVRIFVFGPAKVYNENGLRKLAVVDRTAI